MNHDRIITISIGAGRSSKTWTPQTLAVSELWERLKTPARSSETVAEYMKLNKARQDELKDVGGFVGGTLNGLRRKAANVVGRDILTLDLDNIPARDKDVVLDRLAELGCGYCVYSTRKHHDAAPRLRVLLPLDRTVTAEEYEPCARKMAEYIGLQYADPTTFEASRLMYWPSCCADSQYVYKWSDAPFIAADNLLGQYADWRDISQWPAMPGAQNFTKLAMKQGDPEAKKGVVGAFCRTYDIPRAVTELLPGIYESVDNASGRYTYLGGSTTGGAVLYDNDKFLYSHHATDPCGGKLVNSFDLVRLHMFGDRDDAAQVGTPNAKLPSFTAMCEYAVGLPEVAGSLNRERYQDAAKDFEGLEGEDSDNWMSQLAHNAQTGLPKSTMDNAWIILEHDPRLKGKFALNEFAGRGEVLGELPWDSRSIRRLWDDNDNQGLYWYMERYHHITGTAKIDGALSLHSTRHAFNEVQDYLKGLIGKWDGTPRLDSMFIDYLGAEDTAYTRTITRKAFAAAVARAMTPGCKYDTMVILSGPQGIGKSTILDRMSKGWFNDGIRTFEGKEASELLQGVWLVEVSELDAFRSTDVNRIKQFLSLRVDRFRAAYGRHVKELPRTSVFFGTTNATEFLLDTTGNRRFWPVDTGQQPPTKNVWHDLPGEVDQLWAEAVLRWQLGEPLYLVGEIEKASKAKQEEHRETSSREGIILEFMEQLVPEDWVTWSLDTRRMFWAGGMQSTAPLVPRERICAIEVWCEALQGDAKYLRNFEAREINSILATAPGWKRSKKPQHQGKPYGTQRGFVRA